MEETASNSQESDASTILFSGAITSTRYIPDASFSEESDMPSVLPECSVPASTLSEMGTQINPLDTTVSNVTEARRRTRKSTKWICTFQIMDVPKNTVQLKSRGSFDVTDEKSNGNIDNLLRKFFQFYNLYAKQLRQSNIKVCHALGARYIFHSQINLIAGIVVLETSQMCETPQFDCHLLIEKSRPYIIPTYEDCHKIYIGHAYPIHTSDISCVGGNSLRPLLNNWVDPEDTFFESLHWIIPPSTKSMRKTDPNEADLRDEEVFLDFKELIMEMKKVLTESYRESLDQTQNRSMPTQTQQSTNSSMFEFMSISEGREYSVESDSWYNMQLPLDNNGKINQVAYRAAKSITRRGGIVKTVSTSQ